MGRLFFCTKIPLAQVLMHSVSIGTSARLPQRHNPASELFLPTKSPPSQAQQHDRHVDLVLIDGNDNRFYVYVKIPLAQVLMHSMSLGTSAQLPQRHIPCLRTVFAHKKTAIAGTTTRSPCRFGAY